MSPMPPQIQHWAAACAPRHLISRMRRGCAWGLATCCALAACAWVAPAGAQQAGNGHIYIPGPGEHGTSAPGAGANANANANAASGMITIDPLSTRGEPPRLGASAATQMATSMKAVQPAGPNLPAAPPPSPPSVPAQALASATPGEDPAAPAGQQDGESIRRTAQAFLAQQTVGLPGKITVTVAPTFARGLAACTTLVPFMPPGARVWGRTTVGVRCVGARPWTLYLQARVSLEATYYLAARQIEPGGVLTAADLTTREGDLANLPRTIVTDASQAVGAVALARVGAGMPLRQDMLKSATSVTIGQTVRVVAVGPGFTISSEGSVMNNAAPGEQVRVKTPGGQIISGVVKDGSTVEIQM